MKSVLGRGGHQGRKRVDDCPREQLKGCHLRASRTRICGGDGVIGRKKEALLSRTRREGGKGNKRFLTWARHESPDLESPSIDIYGKTEREGKSLKLRELKRKKENFRHRTRPSDITIRARKNQGEG